MIRLPVISRLALLVPLIALGLAASADAGVPERYRIASEKLIVEGEALLGEGRDDEALKRFEAALVADPASIAALLQIGRLHEAQGRKEIALRYFRRAREIDPADRAALLAEGLALLRDKDIAGARENADRLARICGKAGCAELEALRAALPDEGESD
ncbi:MAG: hypothetical protein Kow00104_06370 [Rhodothalassiaceae bacterium]